MNKFTLVTVIMSFAQIVQGVVIIAPPPTSSSEESQAVEQNSEMVSNLNPALPSMNSMNMMMKTMEIWHTIPLGGKNICRRISCGRCWLYC